MRNPLWIVVGGPLVLGLLGAAAGGGITAVGGFWIGALGVSLWATFDAVGAPRYAWDAAAPSRTFWLVLLIAGLLFCGVVGYLAAVMYFASVRGRVRLGS